MTCHTIVLSRIVGLLLCGVQIAINATTVWGDESPKQESKPAEVKKLILPGESFLVKDRPAFILWPKEELRTTPQPWVFYAPTLEGYPDQHEKWMHEQFLNAGVAVAGIDVGEGYGCPASRELFDAFYEHCVTEKHLSTTPCLLGRSRGGLWVSSWACDHPERFSGLAGIYPVFDFRAYPGIDKAAPSYGLSKEELSRRSEELNPISRSEAIAKARLPVFIIHGDEDVIVPLKENSQTLLETYQKAGAESAISLVVAKGQGHNYWEGFFRCQELVDFVIRHAKQGRTP